MPKMIRPVSPGPLSEADTLRAKLRECEGELSKAILGGGDALAVLLLLDEIDALFQEFAGANVDLRPEEGQRRVLESQVRRKAAVLLRNLNAKGTLKQARGARTRSAAEGEGERAPARTSWWWYLDEWLAAERRRKVRRWLIAIGGVVAVVVLAILAFQLLLPSDPRVRAKLAHQSEAENLVAKGDLAGALKEIEAALAIFPDDPELRIWQGVLLQESGQPAQAGEAFAQAEAGMPERVEYLIVRGMIFIQVGDAQAALADGQAAVKMQPDSARAYYLLGNAHEILGHTQEGLEAFTRAADLAEAQNDPQLVVLARVHIAALMQRAP
jgi:tetratricopeptide (TPR) repeat protein